MSDEFEKRAAADSGSDEKDLEEVAWEDFALRRLGETWTGEDDSLYDYL
jgi:hypothetical protein